MTSLEWPTLLFSVEMLYNHSTSYCQSLVSSDSHVIYIDISMIYVQLACHYLTNIVWGSGQKSFATQFVQQKKT